MGIIPYGLYVPGTAGFGQKYSGWANSPILFRPLLGFRYLHYEPTPGLYPDVESCIHHRSVRRGLSFDYSGREFPLSSCLDRRGVVNFSLRLHPALCSKQPTSLGLFHRGGVFSEERYAGKGQGRSDVFPLGARFLAPGLSGFPSGSQKCGATRLPA